MIRLQKNIRREAYATADATGTATAVVEVNPGPSWMVKQIGVSTNSTVTLPTATTYVGRNTSGVFVSSTLVGNSDTDSLPNVTLRSGESLCAIWAGCTVNDQCKITVIYDEVAY